MITEELFNLAYPRCKEPDIWLPLFQEYLPQFRLTDTTVIANFMAQTGHESGDLNILEENLNYSADRLMVIFPRYFRDKNPKDYHRNPEKIANLVYGNRMGNGSVESGDGYRYRGRGIIQLTGRTNYLACSQGLYDSQLVLEEDPDLLKDSPQAALQSALWYWTSRGLSAFGSDIHGTTKRINGGTHGIDDRVSRYESIESYFS